MMGLAFILFGVLVFMALPSRGRATATALSVVRAYARKLGVEPSEPSVRRLTREELEQKLQELKEANASPRSCCTSSEREL